MRKIIGFKKTIICDTYYGHRRAYVCFMYMRPVAPKSGTTFRYFLKGSCQRRQRSRGTCGAGSRRGSGRRPCGGDRTRPNPDTCGGRGGCLSEDGASAASWRPELLADTVSSLSFKTHSRHQPVGGGGPRRDRRQGLKSRIRASHGFCTHGGDGM